MSIVALKRKSFTQYGKGHVDAKGVFSLNGTSRHPSSLGRAFYGTPMKGPDPKGHGCGRRCRVPGRFARICGSSYPVVIHSTCETLQTEVHPSVKNTSAVLGKLHLGKQYAVSPIPDISSSIQPCIIRHVVDETCHPCTVPYSLFKEKEQIAYEDYLRIKTANCNLQNVIKSHQC